MVYYNYTIQTVLCGSYYPQATGEWRYAKVPKTTVCFSLLLCSTHPEQYGDFSSSPKYQKRQITSSQDQPPQHSPQRLRSFSPLSPQPVFNPTHQPLRLPPQLLNNPCTILEAAFALHILERIPLDFLVIRLLLEDVDEDLIAGIRAYSVDDGEAEFPFCQVLAEALEGGVARCWGEVEVVVEDLEEEADGGYEGSAVAVGM
jgi:hypothetical protein